MPHRISCRVCGTPFVSRQSGAMYCSKPCRAKAQNAKPEQKAKNRANFKKHIARKRASTPPIPCAVCGTPFVPPDPYAIGKNGRGKYCSIQCVGKANSVNLRKPLALPTAGRRTRRRLAAQAALERAAAGSLSAIVLVAGPCPICSTLFVANKSNRHCSTRCTRRASSRNRRAKYGAETDRARARRHGAKYEVINRITVFERDGWSCGICGKPTNRWAKVPHALAPTLDHVIPFARGGDHLYTNVQCAHFECNWRKGDSLPESAAA